MDEEKILEYIRDMARRAAELAEETKIEPEEYEKGITAGEFARAIGQNQTHAQRKLRKLVYEGKLEVGEALRKGITGRVYRAPVYREPRGEEGGGIPG